MVAIVGKTDGSRVVYVNIDTFQRYRYIPSIKSGALDP